jgi:hypothetical protein
MPGLDPGIHQWKSGERKARRFYFDDLWKVS